MAFYTLKIGLENTLSLSLKPADRGVMVNKHSATLVLVAVSVNFLE